jgi:hypothetical protein
MHENIIMKPFTYTINKKLLFKYNVLIFKYSSFADKNPVLVSINSVSWGTVSYKADDNLSLLRNVLFREKIGSISALHK